MALLLAGDIGGTKTILRLVKTEDGKTLETLAENKYVSAKYPDLVPMVQEFLQQATGDSLPTIDKACFAIAGPVVDNTAKLTNLPWCLEGKRLERDLKIAHVGLINDFVAVGYGILGLSPEDLHPLQRGKHHSQAPIAVIGAGTGLGECFLTSHQGEYQVFPTEGGHADFAPRSELEFRLLHYLLEKHDIQRISIERVVSGMGIVAIYQFLRDFQGVSESPEIAQVVRQWESEAGRSQKSVDPAAVISKAALEGSDRLSQETLELFVDAYGAEAGNLALKFLPYGGCYIAGGIAAKILPLMTDGTFLHAFTHKGRMSRLLEQVPLQIVLNPQVGLIGAALYAARL